MTTISTHERTAIIEAGAAAARGGAPRSTNPHSIAGEDWINWMEGFDHQTVWLQRGRGAYEPFARTPSVRT